MQRVVPVPQQMAENIDRIETLSHRLMSALASRAMPNPAVDGPGAEFFMTTAGAWMKMLAEQPARVIEQQVNFWGETLKHYARASQMLARGKIAAPEDDGPQDRRFANPLWQTHPFFNYVKRQYQINADAMRTAASDLDLPDDVAKRRMSWLTSQIIDMMAPTNFLATNPDALEKAIETEGESLVRGLENLVRDVEQNGGEFLVSLADRDAFTVGENIGTTSGTVVYRTDLFELIQYHPTTEQVHAMPVVMFPPWINKFYILDLKPQNSLIRWVVEQGHTLFVVSWKNPDASHADTGMGDYVAAYIEAMDQVMERTGQKKLNAVGYCIGGTTLTATLGVLKKRGDDRVNSATFFTTLTDFSELGEFATFLQDDFIGGIEEEVARKGLFSAILMSRTMSFLRANDLVWGPAIRNYMLGETPPAFDLLYWNGDSTNLPGRMTLEYLNELCRQNHLVAEGFEVLGEKVTLADVTVPLCAVACETDHIAPWKDCWRGFAQTASRDKRFILSESGHIAGIINPPSKKKYGHYLSNAGFDGTWQDWKDDASFHQGSWWPVWGKWLEETAGPMVAARDPGQGLGPAPGTYVHQRANG
ncbi:MAG: class I poly(R)-hydroxyalkanoic acid synthase [Paracoccus sp. (in: a-proteobacteria)]|uniref:PHA/PHB synthase family protein n=1 Tax=Paracoccus sp. TaxID=267 RepID=UPI0026DF2B06|nr:class I poly(R)-hydroxyalkanoic acid synthase [Paracoccus sp. (in: a-proteobacteria)]MDO5631099.1 class I poly(R)-hydroxyalkanoic acid synthase [Paracoccus sp. (in: a-proteobacteria)]